MHHLATMGLKTRVDIGSKESNAMCGCCERRFLLRKNAKRTKKIGDGKRKKRPLLKATILFLRIMKPYQ